jgi:hypothetical protein
VYIAVIIVIIAIAAIGIVATPVHVVIMNKGAAAFTSAVIVVIAALTNHRVFIRNSIIHQKSSATAVTRKGMLVVAVLAIHFTIDHINIIFVFKFTITMVASEYFTHKKSSKHKKPLGIIEPPHIVRTAQKSPYGELN